MAQCQLADDDSPASEQLAPNHRLTAARTSPGGDTLPVSWSQLPPGARAFRVAHLAWGAANMAALGHIWFSAATRRRDRLLTASVALLIAEGLALVVGRGNCPFGPVQRSLGDPLPMFELFLPPRAAKAAIPILTVVSLAGLAALALRREEARGRRSARPNEQTG